MNVFFEAAAGDAMWHGGSADTGHARPINRWPGFTAPVPREQRMALLKRLVAREVLPRLVSSRRDSTAPARTDAPMPATVVDTGELIRLLLTGTAADGMAFIEALLARGATPEQLYTGILPDAARWLGLMWDEDRCDFAQVTIALGWLQQAARGLSSRFQNDAMRPVDANSILLMPAAGEQHSFGLLILAEFFQRAGWRVAGGPKSTGTDPGELARLTWFDIVGFSVGSDRFLDDLAKTILRVRRQSRNRDVRVMVGGPLFRERPELLARAGADAMAADPDTALRLAHGLLTVRAASH